jgi:SsrA-binding protein
VVNKKEERIVCQNKKAYHDYFISDEIEAGIVLVGTEIKSLRASKASLQDCYCEIINGEMFLKGLHISKYEMGNIFNHDPDRLKKLLLNKHEIIRLNTKKQKDGFTIIPLRVIIKNGLAKVVIGLAKGKKLFDKREDLKKSDQLRYIEKSSKQGY